MNNYLQRARDAMQKAEQARENARDAYTEIIAELNKQQADAHQKTAATYALIGIGQHLETITAQMSTVIAMLDKQKGQS